MIWKGGIHEVMRHKTKILTACLRSGTVLPPGLLKPCDPTRAEHIRCIHPVVPAHHPNAKCTVEVSSYLYNINSRHG